MTLDRRRGGTDLVLFYTTVILVAVGVVMVFNASLARPMTATQNAVFYLARQSVFGVVGLLAMLFAMRIPYTRYREMASPFMVATLAMLFLVPFIGIADNGARRWLGYGPIRIQPSEIAKLSLILYLAALLTRRGFDIKDLWGGAIAPLCVLGFACFMVEVEPDLGTALVMGLTGLTVLFLGGARIKHMAGVVGAALLMVGLAALRHPYRLERIRTFLDPERDPTGTTYQVIQGIQAVGSGQWAGLGFGNGRAKFYLPAANTDYIFATLAEEMGLLGGMALIGLFLVMGWRAFLIARDAPDAFGTLVAAGIGAWFSWQALLNMLVVTGAAPATGVPLPFVSYGGSSLVITLVGVGILLNISQYCERRSRRRIGLGA